MTVEAGTLTPSYLVCLNKIEAAKTEFLLPNMPLSSILIVTKSTLVF
jgi:hypothetical protein